ncbi:hypothetical protein M2139_001640 [Enterococcus sp. PF1-24]|uniref:hypothetical protein n=1 Tax=unclassified Enterococcus TaxID=2608891 RepID=UPI002476BCF5|nr:MULTISPECIES: hypothetical protein [unclassified Enterococcus]MDH6364653.1 hypothetical protein [Enterococcus sp. PFB1-1]MDH6401754.1 hypothetical protein [Enterococcus sp. PF1-24]
MKRIQFLGIHASVKGRSTGCSSCGGQGKRFYQNGKFIREKRITLPSGQSINFVLGQTHEVSDADADFLLNLTFPSKNDEQKQAFKIV